MSLFVIIGPQAVGKMTVGRRLEEKIDGKLLYNHQTIDLFAGFLGYTADAFRLSEETRLALFKSFVANRGNNLVGSMIFTVMIGFDVEDDLLFLEKISEIFLSAGESVYFIELESDLETRLKRNVHEERLEAKPSKRNIEFSKKDLLTTHEKYQLNSAPNQVAERFPQVNYLRVDNTKLAPEAVAEQIIAHFSL